MRSGDVINMVGNKINPAFHLQFILLFSLLILCTNHLVLLLCLFVINVIFFIYHKTKIFPFLQICGKLMYFYFGVSILFAIITLDMNVALIIWIKLTLITKNIVYFLHNQDWTELFYALDCLFCSLDYIGINGSKVAWDVTRYFHKLKIYIDTCGQYMIIDITWPINFSWSGICDKIDKTKEIFEMALCNMNNEIKQLDDMMRLRLFRSENSRSNYHVTQWQPLDFVFLVILIFLLASEVIL